MDPSRRPGVLALILVGVVLQTAAFAQVSSRQPPRSTRSQASGDEYIQWYPESRYTCERPDPEVWQYVAVRWDRSYFHDGSLHVEGSLAVERPGEEPCPVDWFQGLQVLVALRTDSAPDWSDGHSEDDTADGMTVLRRDGTFIATLDALPLRKLRSAGGTVQVGLCLGEHIEPAKIRWTNRLPVFPASVARLNIPAPAPFTTKTYRRSYDLIREWDRYDQEGIPGRPTYLEPVPEILALPRRFATETDAERIPALIDSLVEVDHPDVGFNSTMAGTNFLPLPDTETMSAGLLTNHGLSPNETMRELVDLGPRALPYLLQRLDDETLTGLRLVQDPHMGGMWHERRIGGNPFNPHECRALGQSVVGEYIKLRDTFDHIPNYTVTVGDLCFVAIGQITNRAYAALQYQPSGCNVVCSPTSDPELLRMAREIWKGRADAQGLLDFLLIDFCTRSASSYLQIGAAMRLAYYFPEEASRLLTERIGGLHPYYELDLRLTVDCVLLGKFRKATSHTTDPAIHDAWVRAYHEDRTPLAVEEVLQPGHDAILSLLSSLPADGPSQGSVLRFLRRVGEVRPGLLPELVEPFLADGSVARRHALCLFLQERSELPDWAMPWLRTALDDASSTAFWYAIHEEEVWYHTHASPSEPVRICDEAARALRALPGAPSFALRGTHADLDAQIVEMKQWLDTRDR